jgi:hypothetical protein
MCLLSVIHNNGRPAGSSASSLPFHRRKRDVDVKDRSVLHVHGCDTVFLLMATRPQNPAPDPDPSALYCPNCAEEVNDPLTCGDCSSVICRRCGTALESSDELGIG